jgi:hypothetical protein
MGIFMGASSGDVEVDIESPTWYSGDAREGRKKTKGSFR